MGQTEIGGAGALSKIRRIGVLTSGGDAPGMNAAIRSVTRTAIYNGLEVVGIRRGYVGLMEGDFIPLTKSSVGGIIQQGGTILRTARAERFKRKEGINEALAQIKTAEIDAIVVIGGNGSFKGAYELYKAGVKVAGVPATIDNDIGGTDYAIGFDTAVNTAVDAVNKLRDTASSHERLFIIEVMGRNSGFIALYVAVATGAEYVLIPEVDFDVEELCKKLHYSRERGKLHSIVIVAEGVAHAHEVREKIKDTAGYEARIVVLGHLQRGGSPTAFDRLLASVLGNIAVEALLNGENGIMASWQKGEAKVVPINLSWEQEKKPDLKLINLIDILSI